MTIAATVFALAVTSGPAYAALPYCNNVSGVIASGSPITRYETYGSGGSYTVNCDMNYINENGTAGQRTAIKQLQWDLVACYGMNISIDGEYGNQTKQAVKDVQEYLNYAYDAGLTVDGWAGPNTRKKMTHVRYNFSPTPPPPCWSTPNPVIDRWLEAIGVPV